MSKVITKADLVKSINGEITKVYPNTLADNVRFDINSQESVKERIRNLETTTEIINDRVNSMVSIQNDPSNLNIQEIIDARVSSSGVEYSSLGESIRNQINNIANEIERRHNKAPNIKYKIETKIGSAINNNGVYYDKNPTTIDNTRACSAILYPTYGAKLINATIEDGYKAYIVQYENRTQIARSATFFEGNQSITLNNATTHIRAIVKKVDDTEMQITPELDIIIDANIDYVTPQMYKYNDMSWDEAFNLAMDTGKIIFIPEGIYQLEGSININKDGVCMIGAGYNTIICPPRCFNNNTLANTLYGNSNGNAERTIQSDAFKYTYAINVGPVTGVRLSNFRIRAQYEEISIERDHDEDGNDIGPIINVKGTIGCGIITTKANIASRNYFNNLWIEGCLIGISQRATGSIFSDIIIQGLLEYSDFTRKWKNWYNNDEIGTEPLKYNTQWQYVGVISAGTDTYWNNCNILWNNIGLYCYSGEYFTNIKVLENRYNCIIGQKNDSYGNELVTNNEGNIIGDNTCFGVKMSNCYFQEAKCSNLLIYNAINCNIEASIEGAGNTYYPERLNCRNFDKDDIITLPITNIYINSMSYCILNITTKLGNNKGYERYLLYCASDNIHGFNTIKCCVTGPNSPLNHRFDMFGGNIYALLPSEVTINNVNIRDMGIFNETYQNTLNIINSNRISTKHYTSYINGQQIDSAIRINLSDPQINDIITLRLGECKIFAGRFILRSDQLLNGLKMDVLISKIINNQVYIIDGQDPLFASGISDCMFTTQSQVYFGRNMQVSADYAISLKITQLPEINYGDKVQFTITDFTYGLIK